MAPQNGAEGDKNKVHYPFWFGGAASMAAATCTHPLDLAKVRMQMGKDKSLGFIGTIVKVLRNEGFFALYAGLSASLLRQATYSTVRFGVYEELKSVVQSGDADKTTSMLTLVGLACISGAIGAIVGNPADVLNVRMQNDAVLPKAQQRNYKHAFDGLFKMVKEEGALSLSRGITANCGRGILMTASQLASYDTIKQALLRTSFFQEGLVTHFTASFAAGFVATTVCSPFDVIKTRIMNSPKNTSIAEVFKESLNKEGFRFMFKGFMPSFIRLGPQTVVTFIVLEQQKKIYRRLQGP